MNLNHDKGDPTVLMREILEPSACSWCGVARRPHGIQGAGSKRHTWIPPTTQQTLARMMERRSTTEGRTWRWQWRR